MCSMTGARRFGLPLAVAATTLTACDALAPFDLTTSRSEGTVPGNAADPSLACAPALDVPLLAGRTLEVGTVSVANGSTTLYVTFTAQGGWTLASTALYAAAGESDVPVTPAGTPRIGQFPYKASHAEGVTTFTYAVPIPAGGGEVTMAAFAEVHRGDREEGAWADGDRISAIGPWSTYFRYAPDRCSGETIGAGGGSIVFQNLELVIPPGALPGDVLITVRRVDPPAGPLPGDVFLLDGSAFDLGPDGLEFLIPFEIGIGYDPATLPAGVAESDLQIFQLNAGVTALPSTVDAPNDLVTASGSHFSTFGVGAGPGSEDPWIPVACPDLSLTSTSGIPLDRIALGRFPAEWTEPFAARVTDADDRSGVAFVERIEDGTAHLVVPVHPSGSPDAGDVELRFNDGTFACPAVAFSIEALPPAPGEFTALVDVMQEVLDQQAAALGTTAEALRSSDIVDLPITAWPLAIAQSVLDHPDNPNSLRALAQGSAPWAAGSDLAMADRLYARTGIRAALAGSLSGPAPSAGAPASPLAAVSSALECVTGSVTDAPALDFCMRQASSAAFRIDGASGEVLGKLGFAAGAAGLVPLPPVKLASAGAGLAIWTLQSYREGVANLLPSDFVELRFTAAPLEFLEDEAGPGEWFDAEVVATSRGWKMDRLILDAVFQAVGARGAYDAWLERFMDPNLVADLVGLLQTQAVQQAIDSTEGSDFAEWPPELFGPVDVGDPNWATAFVNGAAIELTSETTYEPVAVGVATLDVRIRNEGGQFGGKSIASNDPAEIRVLQLDLDISPVEVTVEPGDPVEFIVTVTNSAHPEMVEVQANHGEAIIVHLGEDRHQIAYAAPSASNLFPDLVIARHTATTGARGAPDAHDRTAIATVRVGRIIISPRDECVEVGAPIAFTAEVEGLSDPAVVWSASLGEIDENTGAYIATTNGTAIVTATSVSNPEIFDRVAIKVGGCTCSWTGLVDGVPFEGMDGDFGELLLTAGGTAIESLIVGRDDASGSIVAVFTTLGGPPLPIGTTGSFPITVTGEGDLAAGTLLGFTSLVPEGTGVQVLITENDGDVLAGSMNGNVFFFEPFPEGRMASFTMSFRITRDPLDSTDLVSHCTIGSDGASGP